MEKKLPDGKLAMRLRTVLKFNRRSNCGTENAQDLTSGMFLNLHSTLESFGMAMYSKLR